MTGSGSATTDRMPHAGAPLELVRFALIGRRNARRYLQKRGVAWPPVDFRVLARAVRDMDAERARGAR